MTITELETKINEYKTLKGRVEELDIAATSIAEDMPDCFVVMRHIPDASGLYRPDVSIATDSRTILPYFEKELDRQERLLAKLAKEIGIGQRDDA